MTVEQAVHTAIAHHRAGQLAEAERLYRQVLARDPNNFNALHLLGMIANQMGHPKDACELIARSVAIHPAPESLFNLAIALEIVGQIDRAIAALRQALALKSDWADAHGNLALLLQLQNQIPEALTHFARAVALDPDSASHHFNFGSALILDKQWEQAITELTAALRLKPSHPEAHNNLGHVLLGQERCEQAIQEFEQALRFRPDYPDALSNLGNALNSLKRYEESLVPLQQAVAAHPDFPLAYNNLGNTFAGLGQLDKAVEAYRKALDLNPGWPEAQANLSTALRLLGGIDEAIAAAEKALIQPPGAPQSGANRAQSLNSLANAYRSAARIDEALENYARATEADPNYHIAASNYVFALQFQATDPQVLLDANRQWDARYAAPLRSEIQPFDNDPAPRRRLRVGYVSPDFRNHCQALFTSAIFPHHDHEQFEFYFYADVPRPDVVTHRLQTHADVWRPTAGMKDAALADLIRSDRIDILIDLTMHMSGCRPLLFARKPAPLQICWLAYPGTTGLSTMDYRFTDPHLDPTGCENRYVERSLHLPHTFWCYDPAGLAMKPSDSLPEPGELPALKNGFLTFGCLNDFSKLNPDTLLRWSHIMHAAPDSRLHLLAPRGRCRDLALARFNAFGIEPSRIEFIDRQPRPPYLAEYQRIDLCLDTLPANGHTTSLDAFWMGVPVLTRVGPTVTGRAGFSQLMNLGINDFAADSNDQFVELARRWCNDLTGLAQLRRSLRQRMAASPLMDGKKFAASMESAFRNIWIQWCSAQSPGDS